MGQSAQQAVLSTISVMSYASLSLSAKVCVRGNVQALEEELVKECHRAMRIAVITWVEDAPLWIKITCSAVRMIACDCIRIRAFSASHIILNNRRCIIICWGKMPFQLLIVSMRSGAIPFFLLLICFAFSFLFCTGKIYKTNFLYAKKC